MKLSQLFLIIRVRIKIVLIILLAVVGATMLVSLFMPKTYQASSQVVLNYRGTDAVTGLATPQQQMQSYLQTQIGILTSRNVALKVVDSLKLPEKENFKTEFQKSRHSQGDIREWIADGLLKNLDALPLRESGVIVIGFKWSDPNFAAAAANAFATQYRQTTIQIRTGPLDEVGGYFNKQIKEIRINLENAQRRLSEYQQEKGIVSADIRLDFETMRLNEISSQLVAVQGQLMDANYRQKQATGTSAGDSPDIISNQLIQNLKSSLVQAEAKLAKLEIQYMPTHPYYIGALAEVERLRSELNKNIKITANSMAKNTNAIRQREQELRESLQAQKERLLKLNRSRDELAVLSREVESTQRAYDNAMTRFNQIGLEGNAKQTDVLILSKAVVPADASSPKILLNFLLSVVLGGMVGMGVAFISEMLNRKVRHACDLGDILQAPVIGVMELSKPKLR